MSPRPLRLVRLENGWVEICLGDEPRGSYAALPSPVDCAAFGGECEC